MNCSSFSVGIRNVPPASRLLTTFETPFFIPSETRKQVGNEQSRKIKIIFSNWVFFSNFPMADFDLLQPQKLLWLKVKKNMPTFPISKNHSSKAAFSQLFYVIHNIWGKTSKHCTGLLLNIQSLTWWSSITWKKYSWMLWTEAGSSSIWIILRTLYLFGQLIFLVLF